MKLINFNQNGNVLRILAIIFLIVVVLQISGCGPDCTGGTLDNGGALEKGRCSTSCSGHSGADWEAVQNCDSVFIGSRGNCQFGQVCASDCTCMMVDKDMDTFVENHDGVYSNGAMTKEEYNGQAGDIYGIYDWRGNLVTVSGKEYLGGLSVSAEGIVSPEDCDDTNSMIHPYAVEVCNGIDDDCSKDNGELGFDNKSDTGIDMRLGDTDTSFVCNKTVYLCNEQLDERDITYPFQCKGKLWCSGMVYFDSQLNTNRMDCDFEAKKANLPEGYQTGNQLDIYAYVCDNNLKKCSAFNKQSFRVCAEKERCAQAEGGVSEFKNEDMDCDGYLPYKPIKDSTGVITGTDFSSPLDPDCKSFCVQDSCNLTAKSWCDTSTGEAMWKTDNYCSICGATDSTCAISCEPGELSCDGGCLEGACDLAADKICKGGSWTTTGYSSACSKNDSSIGGTESTSECTPNACDTEFDKVCYGDPKTWRTTGGVGTPYCDLPACKVKDASCAKPCTPSVCDVFSNAYCTSTGAWSAMGAADYCSKCGAIDSNCGSIPCTDTKADGSPNCDIAHKKFCSSGEWKDVLTDYCNKCSAVDEPTCMASCPPLDEQTASEINCTDGIDNNCDGTADCRDPACNYLEECRNACRFGVTDNCGPSEGICLPQGTRTCAIDGRYGECIGGTAPQTEVCNHVDDNCDGAVDEGCVCTIGQSQPCGFDSGSCRAGVQRCADGKWGYCYRTSRASPTKEECDGVDNDCDGDTDEGCPCVEGSNQSCNGREGTICKAGMQVCTDGTWGACAGEIKPMTENKNTGSTCSDTIDNDCDTKADAADDGCGITPADQITPSCFDAIKNQGETDVDCGGPCSACVTPANCNNRKMDPGEDGPDCGGECSVPCNDRTRLRTGPSEEETEEETITEPVCGDAECNGDETEETCPDDCETPSTFSFGSFLIPAIIIIALVLGGFVAYKKGLIKMKGKGAPKQSFPAPKGTASSGAAQSSQAFRQMPSASLKAAAQKAPQRKEVKTREELELEKSFKEESELLKK